MNKKESTWGISLATESTAPVPGLAELFDGSPSTREERDINRKFTLDIWNQAGITYKAELAQHEVEYLQQGAFDRSVDVVDYMVQKRDQLSHPETREFANQLLHQAASRDAELQFHLVEIAGGRLADLMARSIDPDPEPIRHPGFWERLLGS